MNQGRVNRMHEDTELPRDVGSAPTQTTADDAAGDRARKPQTMVNSIVQALAILRFLARSRESQGVTAIARQVGINPSSAFNIVKTLTAENFLHFNESKKTYALGPGALELAGVALDSKNAFDRTRDLLDDIVLRFGVTSAFWRLTDDERLVLVGIVESKGMMRIQMTVGQRIPAFSGAMGRCYAGALKLAEEALRAKFEAVRWQQKPDFASYVSEVRDVAQRGWAIDRDQFIRGIVTVAAPIMDRQGKLRFFLANSSFVGQLDGDQLQALGMLSREASLRAVELLYG